MPELPEVETARRVAERRLVGKVVVGIECDDPRLLRSTSPQGLGRAVSGATVVAAERTGKWVRLATDATSDVLVHFGMTGSFHWHAQEPDEDEHGLPPCEFDHVRWSTAEGVFALHMPRKLGGCWLVRTDEERREVTGRLGVDALDADADTLRAELADSRAGLKSALMDQDRVAGIGNLLSDELCWQVAIHPSTPCDTLDDAVFDELADELARALDVGLDLGHVPTADGFLLDVRHRDDAACPRCGERLVSATIAGRTSVWCPAEQPDPR